MSQFREQLEEACAGLSYRSETDEQIQPFYSGRVDSGVCETLVAEIGAKEEDQVEEISFHEVFDRLCTIHGWFGEKEKGMRRDSFIYGSCFRKILRT